MSLLRGANTEIYKIIGQRRSLKNCQALKSSNKGVTWGKVVCFGSGRRCLKVKVKYTVSHGCDWTTLLN